MKFNIRKAEQSDIPAIREIAQKTWPQTYASIISPEQIDYMLGWMYSEEKLAEAIADNNQDFLVLENEQTMLGFTGIEHHYQGKDITRIHKLYVLPETQGTGAGKTLLEEIIRQAKLNNSAMLHLNVNKANKAVSFYEHVGFVVSDQEVLDIGNGFVMDDYIMTKEI